MDEGAKHTLPNMADRHTFTIACYDATDTLVEVLETTFMPVVVQGHLSKVRVHAHSILQTQQVAYSNNIVEDRMV
jgi:hypothetical protein